MGILNVTPDSFSDGGRHLVTEQAVAHGRRLLAEGAEIVDIGGESTRPGAEAVSAEEELRRVLPVVRALRAAEPQALLSIDTSKASVAEAALATGADIVNDITALRGDPAMAEVVARHGAGVCLMHIQGQPRTMQQAPHYLDVVAEVAAALRSALAAALTAGVARECVALDPGIGFGKSRAHNQALLRRLDALQDVAPDRPLLVGISRKSFLGGAVEDRLWPTVALTAALRSAGARVHRVHDVRPNLDALRMAEAIDG